MPEQQHTLEIELPAPMNITSSGWNLEYWYFKIKNSEVLPASYQRQDYVWTREMQSLLIESFILGYFVPETCLEASGDSIERIVDGLQRLSTWVRFRENKLRLKGLKVLPALNGKCWNDLSPELQQRLKRFTLRYNILPGGSGPETFGRLNNTSPIKPTEGLRASCPGPAWPTIERLAEQLVEMTSPHRRLNLAKRCGHHEHVLWGIMGLNFQWRIYERGIGAELGFFDFPLRRGGNDWRPCWIRECLMKLHTLAPAALRKIENEWLDTAAVVVRVFEDSAFGQVRAPGLDQRQRYNGTATALQFNGISLVGGGRALEHADDLYLVYQNLPMGCPGRIDLQVTYKKVRKALAGLGLAPPMTSGDAN